MKSLIRILENYKTLIIGSIDRDEKHYSFIPRGNILIIFYASRGFQLIISTSQDHVHSNMYTSPPDSWFSLNSGWLNKDTSRRCYYTRKSGMPGCKTRFVGFLRSPRHFSDGSYRDFPRLIKMYNISPSFKDFKNEIEFILENELLKLI